MGPLQALAQTYDRRMEWTLSMPRLGASGSARHKTVEADLPEPDLAEPNSQSKDPHVLCVEVANEDGVLKLVPLLSPCSYSRGSKLTKELVRSGVHPLDIKIATLDLSTINGRLLRRDVEPSWIFRDAVEWMFWTHEDQKKLEAEEENDA